MHHHQHQRHGTHRARRAHVDRRASLRAPHLTACRSQQISRDNLPQRTGSAPTFVGARTWSLCRRHTSRRTCRSPLSRPCACRVVRLSAMLDLVRFGWAGAEHKLRVLWWKCGGVVPLVPSRFSRQVCVAPRTCGRSRAAATADDGSRRHRCLRRATPLVGACFLLRAHGCKRLHRFIPPVIATQVPRSHRAGPRLAHTGYLDIPSSRTQRYEQFVRT
jgi:hypothetical protein